MSTVRTAWFCPSCQKHHGPHVDTCPALVDAIGTKTIPPVRYPNEPVVLYEEWMKRLNADPCAGCNGICGNVACPKRMTITCGAAFTAARANQ